jgi:hypothetical protein
MGGPVCVKLCFLTIVPLSFYEMALIAGSVYEFAKVIDKLTNPPNGKQA